MRSARVLVDRNDTEGERGGKPKRESSILCEFGVELPAGPRFKTCQSVLTAFFVGAVLAPTGGGGGPHLICYLSPVHELEK